MVRGPRQNMRTPDRFILYLCDDKDQKPNIGSPKVRKPLSLSPVIPAAQASQGTRGLRFLLVTSLLVGLSLAVFGSLHVLLRRPASVLLITPKSPTLDFSQRSALGTVIQDHLEALGGLPIGNAEELPSVGQMASFPGRTLILLPTVSRIENRLSLSIRHAWLSNLRRDPAGCWRETPVQVENPATVLLRSLKALPLSLTRIESSHLVPAREDLFWDLIQGQAWHRNEGRLDQAEELGRKVTEAEPNCATAWILRGEILYTRLLSEPKTHSGSQAEAESHFAKALSLVPYHPRGSFLLAEMRIDAGDQRTALAQLQAALRHFPKVTALYSGLAYAARTAGLLDLAQKALTRRNELCPPAFSSHTSENTYLYLGDRRRFEESLLEFEGNPRNEVTRFYRAYLALAAGDLRGAHQGFLKAASTGEKQGQFHQLSILYADLAAGRDAEALASLRRLESSRVGLRVPDGEFTFKMGEAYALLGQREAALDLLSRAFAQGFGCARWYTESPFLGSLRTLPRWRALVLHIQERQQLLEGRYPPSEFGL